MKERLKKKVNDIDGNFKKLTNLKIEIDISEERLFKKMLNEENEIIKSSEIFIKFKLEELFKLDVKSFVYLGISNVKNAFAKFDSSWKIEKDDNLCEELSNESNIKKMSEEITLEKSQTHSIIKHEDQIKNIHKSNKLDNLRLKVPEYTVISYSFAATFIISILAAEYKIIGAIVGSFITVGVYLTSFMVMSIIYILFLAFVENK